MRSGRNVGRQSFADIELDENGVDNPENNFVLSKLYPKKSPILFN